MRAMATTRIFESSTDRPVAKVKRVQMAICRDLGRISLHLHFLLFLVDPTLEILDDSRPYEWIGAV